MIVNTKNRIDKLIHITIIIGLIELSVITFLISANVKTERYFKNSVESASVEIICKI